jgi:hypothetical protein
MYVCMAPVNCLEAAAAGGARAPNLTNADRASILFVSGERPGGPVAPRA